MQCIFLNISAISSIWVIYTDILVSSEGDVIPTMGPHHPQEDRLSHGSQFKQMPYRLILWGHFSIEGLFISDISNLFQLT